MNDPTGMTMPSDYVVADLGEAIADIRNAWGFDHIEHTGPIGWTFVEARSRA